MLYILIYTSLYCWVIFIIWIYHKFYLAVLRTHYWLYSHFTQSPMPYVLITLKSDVIASIITWRLLLWMWPLPPLYPLCIFFHSIASAASPHINLQDSKSSRTGLLSLYLIMKTCSIMICWIVDTISYLNRYLTLTGLVQREGFLPNTRTSRLFQVIPITLSRNKTQRIHLVGTNVACFHSANSLWHYLIPMI